MFCEEDPGLWILCTNPAHSWINQNSARDILERLDFLVVQDMYHSTETARMADLVLPAVRLGRKRRHVHQFRTPHRCDLEKFVELPGRPCPTSTSFDSWQTRGAAETCLLAGHHRPPCSTC
ncbi:MAG: molybdopterin-dependent oxidoreductase [Planctomycetaceae bacterium]